MDARPHPPKATPKSLRTRARILEAATRLFAEIGYHGATNPVIAGAAGLTRGAMLYHFATREELVEAAIQHIELSRTRLFGCDLGHPWPGRLRGGHRRLLGVVARAALRGLRRT